MIRVSGLIAAILILHGCSAEEQSSPVPAPTKAEAASTIYDQRRDDWRIGAVTYQIFVDRYVPAENLDAKRALYAPPKILKEWSDQPARGEPVPEAGIWTHELSFWGGDLNSIRTKVGYLEALGVDVVYLNPIHLAPSNHKYDAISYTELSPEYGTFEDLTALADDIHEADMRLVIDGVFNHMGRRSEWFLAAMEDENSPYRGWFTIGEEYQNGYVGWWGIANLPELNWENPVVRARIVDDEDSVVRKWFDYGIDGWRLDVATELGFDNLTAITSAAHEEKAGSLVIGEVWSYPEKWTGALDAVMNFPMREMMFRYTAGEVTGARFGEVVEEMAEDAGLDPLLRSWILLDNHDTPRLKTLYPDEEDRAFLQALQFTLPGAPLLYYGVEAGMSGGHDPESRGPMDWEGASPDNPEFARLQQLIELREETPALRIGDFRALEMEELLAFLRVTDHYAETVLVVANNKGVPVTETFLLREGSIMNGEEFEDQLTGEVIKSESAVMSVTVPPMTVRILKPKLWREHTERTGHSPYKNVP
ncbi:glycoside hydrolase family 13 protein [Parvularcula marina]|uniref:Glycoside hydrolase family 13 protein n=1 Tax=Parvularcula marina TaxID=2292771 RepID=A0A371R835_9PROT|nr:glycoside hydrolase family 13 protein [Parvularcula marina]RFB01605.1 glycoside hydrolase family 13 protein [Parvularcula marina]